MTTRVELFLSAAKKYEEAADFARDAKGYFGSAEAFQYKIKEAEMRAKADEMRAWAKKEYQ